MEACMSMGGSDDNGVKYRVLSNATGEVHLTWAVKRLTMPPHLHLRWEERGGPPVEASKRRGFGSRLIEHNLAQDLHGEARMEFAPSGVTCTLNAPLIP
jgi:two-component sensor histidine kinase